VKNLKAKRTEVERLNIKAAMRELASVLGAVTARRAEYEKAIRQTRWAEGPISIIGCGTSVHAARAGAQAFEWLLGWPARDHEAREFLGYSFPTLRPHSLLIAASASGEDEETVEAARSAQRKGAKVLALTARPESRLAQAARAIFPLPPVKEDFALLAEPLAHQAALLEIAVVAAGIFNPRNQHLEGIEFESLPETAASMEVHLEDPLRSLAFRSKGCRLVVAGAGFYHPCALEAAALARRITSQPLEALPLESAGEYRPAALTTQDAFLLLSSSHCRVMKAVHALAAQFKTTRAQVFALTDASDHGLIDLSGFSVLMPRLPEIPGSLLLTVFLQRLVLERAALAAKSQENVRNI
jgi:fructoselysine-6-P-deglycase FrlB-like protein